LPHPAKKRLREMDANRDSSVVLEFVFARGLERANGREVNSWRPLTVGGIAAPQAINPVRIINLGKRLRYLQSASADAKGQSAAFFEKLDRCMADLVESERDLTQFLCPDNLKMLAWICARLPDQLAAARAALQLSGAHTDEKAAVAALDRWRSQLLDLHGAHLVRVP